MFLLCRCRSWKLLRLPFVAGTAVRGVASSSNHHHSPSSPNPPSSSRRKQHYHHRNSLTQLSNDDLRKELFRFGRRAATTEHVAAVVDEVIARVDNVPHLLYRDACYLANSVGLHTRCVELCEKRSTAKWHGSTFCVFEAVVDSAFELSSSAVGHHRFERDINDGNGSNSRSSYALRTLVGLAEIAVKKKLMEEPEEAASELSVFRAFWRCFVVAMRRTRNESNPSAVAHSTLPIRRATNTQRETSQEAVAIEGQQEEEEWENVLKNISSSSVGASLERQAAAVSSLREPWQAAEKIYRLMCSYNAEVARNTTFDEFASRTWRFVLYGLADDGEREFFWHCSQSLLQSRHCRPPALTISLMKSCLASRASGMLEKYYSTAWAAARTTVVSPSSSVAEGEARSKGGESRTIEELVIHTYLQLMTTMQEPAKVLAATKELLALGERISGGYQPSPAIVALGVRAAGELNDLQFVLRGFNIIIADDSSLLSAREPSPYELFLCFVALARCGAPQFQSILESCMENKVYDFTEEELAYLLLLFAGAAPDPKVILEQVIGQLDTSAAIAPPSHNSNGKSSKERVPSSVDAIVYSKRLVTQLLRVMAMVDHDDLQGRFRTAFEQLGTTPKERAKATPMAWFAALVSWSYRRRQLLTESELEFVLCVAKDKGFTASNPSLVAAANTYRFGTDAQQQQRQRSVIRNDFRSDLVGLMWEGKLRLGGGAPSASFYDGLSGLGAMDVVSMIGIGTFRSGAMSNGTVASLPAGQWGCTREERLAKVVAELELCDLQQQSNINSMLLQ